MSTLEKLPVLPDLVHRITDRGERPTGGPGWRSGVATVGGALGVAALSAAISAARDRSERST